MRIFVFLDDFYTYNVRYNYKFYNSITVYILSVYVCLFTSACFHLSTRNAE